MNNIINFLFRFAASKERATQIRNNPEKRAKSVRFGVISIVNSIFMILLSCFALLFKLKETSSALYIVLFIFVVLAFVGTLLCLVNSITNLILQFSLNKNWSTWTSLAMLLVGIAASAVIIIVGLSAI